MIINYVLRNIKTFQYVLLYIIFMEYIKFMNFNQYTNMIGNPVFHKPCL